MGSTRKWAAAASMAALALALLLTGCAEPRAQAASGTVAERLDSVTAVGEGESAAAPDRARIDFTVSVLRADSKRALNDASKKAEGIAKALRKAGIAKSDLQTSNVSMYPERNNQGKITGYHASLSLQAEVKDIGDVGAVIAAGTNAGATDFAGPSFYLSKGNEAHDRAIEDAVADAKRRAEIMAKAAGKSVGGVVAISEQSIGGGPEPMYRAKALMDSAAGAVPIETGELDATAQVTVVFELR